MMLADAISIAPTIVWCVTGGVFFDLYAVNSVANAMRLPRMLRGLKLVRYFPGLRLLVRVVRDKRIEIATAFLLSVLTVSMLASVVYLAEKDVNDRIRTMWQAYYWAVISLSTVGFGDTAPVTPVGRVLFTLGALGLIGLFTLPSGIIATGFTQRLDRQRINFTRGIIKLDRIDRRLELKVSMARWAWAAQEMRSAEDEAASVAFSQATPRGELGSMAHAGLAALGGLQRAGTLGPGALAWAFGDGLARTNYMSEMPRTSEASPSMGPFGLGSPALGSFSRTSSVGGSIGSPHRIASARSIRSSTGRVAAPVVGPVGGSSTSRPPSLGTVREMRGESLSRRRIGSTSMAMPGGGAFSGIADPLPSLLIGGGGARGEGKEESDGQRNGLDRRTSFDAEVGAEMVSSLDGDSDSSSALGRDSVGDARTGSPAAETVD